MRLTLVVGLALAFLLAPTAARASDASLKSTAKRELTRLGKAESKYKKSTADADSDADLPKVKAAAQKLVTAIDLFHDKIEAEQADSSKLKTAREKLLKASETYSKGVNQLIDAIDANSESKVKAAVKTIKKSYKQFYAAGKALGSAG